MLIEKSFQGLHYGRHLKIKVLPTYLRETYFTIYWRRSRILLHAIQMGCRYLPVKF